MSFKENLKYELSVCGCSIKDFARKVNVNYDTVLSYIDARETRPSAENAVKIAKGLNVSVEYLVTGEKNELDEYIKNKSYFENLQFLPYEVSNELKKLVSILMKNEKKSSLKYSL